MRAKSPDTLSSCPWLALALSFLLLSPAAGESAEKTAAYSRDQILPLVSESGKQRTLFSAFTNGQDATWNKNFWGFTLGFDQFTGIGWGTERAGVLITPEHVVCAAHYPVNDKGVHFYGYDGKYLGGRVPAKNAEGKILGASITPDIRIIKLDSPAPAGARIYPLPDPETHEQRIAWGALPDDERPLLLATDWRNPKPKKTEDPKERQRWRIARSVHPVTLAPGPPAGKTLHWAYGPRGDVAIDSSYHETVNQGDSSHPIFWVSKSGLVLASTFTGTTGGPDSGNPEIQKAIQEAIEKLAGERDYTLKTVSVP
jgi:hypothetical protein